MAITRVGGSWIHKYVSLVADDVTHTYTRAAKPELNLPNGSRCFEMDSDIEYIYDRENDAWEVYVPSSGEGSGGTTDYTQLTNKPSINNVQLNGNKSLNDLGIASSNDVSALSTAITNMEPKVNDAASVIINTASGDIVSFDDGTDNRKIKKLVGTIVPQQDLHGYDTPWPAGGGVNKIDLRNVDTTIGGLHVTGDAQGILSISGTRDDTTGWKVVKVFESLPEGNYVFSSSDSHFTCLLGYTQKTSTFTVSSGDVVRVALTNTVAGETYNVTNAKVQIETGSTASEWAPYENICPISGWTGANIEQRVNFFDQDTIYANFKQQDGSFFGGANTFSGVRFTIPARLIGKQLTWSVYIKIPSGSTVVNPRVLAMIGGNQVNGNFISSADYTRSVVSFTPTSMEDYICVSYGSGGSQNIQLKDCQLEVSSVATEYKPYVAITLPINWEDEAGTIYGGTITLYENESVDVVAEFAKRTISSISGSFGATNKGYAYYITLTGTNHTVPYVKQGNMRSNLFSYYPSSRADAPLYSYGGKDGADTTLFFILPSTITTVADANAWFASNPTDITVYLATPQTYHFDNVGQLYTFLGTNNVWIDTGAITECDYPADTKTYIDNNDDRGVEDVQIDGTSILQNGVANIPLANSTTPGVVKVNHSYGIKLENGRLRINEATDGLIKLGNDLDYPIVSKNANTATFYGLAKAAGDTTMPNSSNAVGTYTEAAKTAIRAMLGVTDSAGGMNVITLTGTNITQTAAENTMYKCGELAELTFTAPASGITAVRFSSGSTPTVASFPGVTWLGDFDPDNLLSNVTYEINIFDGVGVAGWA